MLPNPPIPFNDPAADDYQSTRIAHWDGVARNYGRHTSWGTRAYYRRIKAVYQFLVSPGQRVLEIGSGPGHLLADLQPSVGVGVDFSPEMCRMARRAFPGLTFVQADAHDLSGLEGPFDVILLSDTVNELWDVQSVFDGLRRLSTPRTRLILNFYNRLWEPPLGLVRRLGLAAPTLTQNWLTVEDVRNLLHLAGFEAVRNWQEIVLPLPIPLIEPLFNKFLARFWPLKDMALSNFVIARPEPGNDVGRNDIPQMPGRVGFHPAPQEKPTVSVIVPARNEAGNIPAIFERVPEMGGGTELIFVEGHSKDETYAVIEREIAGRPARSARLFRQTGIGKADAVRLGFAEARGDILMILDADLTVPPEDLPRFYEALVSGRGEFINGVRLVYPMQEQAMRTLNFFGNKFFSLAFSWLLGQPIKDTLCGTKVLWREDYERIAANRSYFGDFDPFGDFDLIFGAAKLNLKIVDLPIRYRERTYGETNIDRWRHGMLLFRMIAFAARRLKFI